MNSTGHLTDSELDDLLLGIGSREAETHVVSCSLCASRRTEFTATIASFNDATLAWANAKSNTLTRDLTATVTNAPSRLASAAAGLCAATLAAAVVVAILPGQRDPGPPHVQTAPVDRDREIARDDAMLQEIDAALYRPDPSPEQVYGLSAPSNAPRHRGTSSEVSE